MSTREQFRQQIVDSARDGDDMAQARAAAALWWLDRSGSVTCGWRDAEVILAGQADKSADVQSALSAIRLLRGNVGYRR